MRVTRTLIQVCLPPTSCSFIPTVCMLTLPTTTGDNRSLFNKADAEKRYEESPASTEANKRNAPEVREEAKLTQMDPTKPVCSGRAMSCLTCQVVC